MSKNFFKRHRGKIITGLCVISLPFFAHAASDSYTLLTPLPYFGNQIDVSGTNAGGFSKFFYTVFVIMIATAIVLAVLQITRAGILYATTDAINGKKEGREMLEKAIYGLLFVLSIVVVLRALNPDLAQFNLNLSLNNVTASNAPTTVVITSPGSGTPGITMNRYRTYTIDGSNLGIGQIFVIDERTNSGGGAHWHMQFNGASGSSGYSEDDMRAYIANAGISINAGPCRGSQTTGCTNVANLPLDVIDDLAILKEACGCSITISGGTEPGHKAHGPGRAVVDVRSDNGALDNYIQAAGKQGTFDTLDQID